MGGDTQVTVRYAPYLEKLHRTISGIDVENVVFTMTQALNAVWHKSPYKEGFEKINVDRGFFGVIEGDPTLHYRIEDFPSLWDMFGKFMGGMDLHVLWGDVYEDVVHGPEIANTVTAHAALLKDELDTRVLPQFLGGMRDINAIQSTTFVIGKALIYDTHTKAVNEFAGNLRIAALDLSQRMWARHLDWDAQVITVYTNMFKEYFSIKLDNDARQLEYDTKDLLWDLSLFDHARAYIGALNGAAAATQQTTPMWKQILGTTLAVAGTAAMFL